MRRLLATLLLFSALALAFADDAVNGARPDKIGPAAASGRIIKVLPLFLDLKGHDALSPSLYDRDAYQIYLSQHTNEISGIRFDVLWKAAKGREAKIKLRVELRGAGSGGLPRQMTLEQTVTPGAFRRWTALTFDGADYKNFGKLVAWRATLWLDDRLLGEQQSFLW